MSDFQRFERALKAAAAAGDVDGARQLASQMRKMMLAQDPSLGVKADPRKEAAKMAAKGMGVGETLAVSAGRGMDKIGAGVEQLAQLTRTLPSYGASQVPGDIQATAEKRLVEMKGEEQEKDIAFSGVQRERPFTSAVGEAAPYAAIPASMGLLGSSAVVGGLEASKYGTGQERLSRGILGAGANMVGGAAGNAVGGLLAPVGKGAVSGAQRLALEGMDAMGVKSRMSQVTGSPFWSRIEDWAARTPGGAGVMREFGDANQSAINARAGQAIGESGVTEMSPAVFGDAAKRMGGVFDEIKSLGGRPIQVGSGVASAADDVLRQQKKMLPTQQDQNLISIANQAKALSANKGRIDGETYQLIRSGLSEASFDATGSNKVLYGKLLSALDDSADSSLRAGGKADLADALKTVRPQYGNLKLLEKGAVAEGGNVSPARLASAMRGQNPAAFREGRMAGNPLYDIAQMGENFKPLQAGSPTYERGLMSNPVSTILGAMGSYPAAKLATSQAAQFYPRHIGGTPAAGALAELARSGAKAPAMALFQTAAGPMLLPIVPE
jgi:hypothetical protein